MFKYKIFNIFAFICLIFWSNQVQLNDKECIQSNFELVEEGGGAILNNTKIYINFFGYNNMPNKKTIWTKKIESDCQILEFINAENIKFVQKWNLKNKNQPVLNLIISRKNQPMNLRHELIVTITPNKESFWLLHFEKIEKKLNHLLPLNVFINQTGWISLSNKEYLFAMLVNKEKFELEQNVLKIYKENLNTDIINEQYQFHSSGKQYFILKNQTKFSELEDNVDFGYYFHKPAQALYILFKKKQEYLQNIWLSIAFIIIFLGLLFSPISIESIQMQQKIDFMQPELDAINNDSGLGFTKKQALIKEIHLRYDYSQLKHLLAQFLLIIGLTIFQSVFDSVEFMHLIPDSNFLHIIIISLLSFTMIVYNKTVFKNTQPLLSALFSLFFINYPKLPLIAFIILHWFNIVLSYIYKAKQYE